MREKEQSYKEKEPRALSREFGEGGYTFLKRVLKENLNSGEPIVINSGKNYLQYKYEPGQKTFMEGVTVLDGSEESALEAFRSVAETYDVERGIEEIKEN